MPARPPMTPSWLPLVAAFVIWFAHFMLCWAAAELLWPQQWMANGLAWGATLLALGALGWHGRRLRRGPSDGGLADWARRVGQGATAIAMVAVVFTVVPSFVFRP
jgi:hypothetical protein